jgi:hypothetical protein
VFSLVFAVALAGTHGAWPSPVAFAQEGGLDAAGQADAKEAMRLYKQGLYEDAAKLFAKLSVDYPHMLVFERNLGACYYYLKRPDPAISNLRDYLARKKDITADDRQVVEGWIAQMEGLRSQATPPAPQPAVAATAAFPAQPALVPQPVPPAAPAATYAPIPAATAAPATIPAEPAPGPQPAPTAVATYAPIPTAAPVAPVPTVEPAASTQTSPAGLDLSQQSRTTEAPESSAPFYKTWWFWAGAVVVVGGAVTSFILASHHETQNACSGGNLPCDAIK